MNHKQQLWRQMLIKSFEAGFLGMSLMPVLVLLLLQNNLSSPIIGVGIWISFSMGIRAITYVFSEWSLFITMSIAGVGATQAIPTLLAMSSRPSEWNVLTSILSALVLGGIIWGDWLLGEALNTLSILAKVRKKEYFSSMAKIGRSVVFAACCFGWLVMIFGRYVIADAPHVTLFKAVKQGDMKTVQQLISYIDINRRITMNNATLLHMAAIYGQVAIVELLVTSGANLHAEDSLGFTPLHYAVEGTEPSVVELLLDMGADVNARSQTEDTSLHCVVLPRVIYGCTGPIPHVDFLQQHDEPPQEQTDTLCETSYDAEGNRVLIMKMLIAHGADVNARASSGSTSLHYAVLYGSASLAELLLSRGADVMIQDDDGMLPVELTEDPDILELFQTYTNTKEVSGNT